MRKRSSSQVLAQHALDFGRLEALAIVQAAEQAVDNFLGFIFAEVLDEAVEKVLAGHGVIDLGFLIMVLQLGKIHYAELAGVPSLAVDFEHHFVGLKQHKYYSCIGGRASEVWAGSASGTLFPSSTPAASSQTCSSRQRQLAAGARDGI